jgi:hypothetical protein
MESRKEDAQVHGLLPRPKAGQVRRPEYGKACLNPKIPTFKQQGFCFIAWELGEVIRCLSEALKDPSDYYVRGTSKSYQPGEFGRLVDLLGDSRQYPEQNLLGH